MNVKLTPQRSFISIMFLALFSVSGYFSVNLADTFLGQEPPDKFPAAQQTYVNGTPSDASLKSEMPYFNVYPNPFSGGYFFIDIMKDNPTFENDNYRAIVYDVLGRQVSGMLLKNGRNTVHADNFAPGTYLVTVVEGDRILTTQRVIKQN